MTHQKPLHDQRVRPTRCFIVQPDLRERVQKRSVESVLEEAHGLAEAIQLEVVGGIVKPVLKPSSATLLGKGQVEEIAAYVKENEVELVFVNHTLTPPQQRNLEEAWQAKVIDRTGLILEIFGARASTREGQLQVELASLSYQRSRLVRSWTHLERQRGGFGFLGGPGESQLEIDRRLISTRIIKIKDELEDVRRTRQLARSARIRNEQPVIALVGYTNAGKSTLFNRLTRSEVLAKNLLFATLDPTMRVMKLPSNREVILSDTVGFISDLPTHLVEAFRATLEEVEHADLILHVRDVAHADSPAQKEDVEAVLETMNIKSNDPRVIEILNKADLLPEEDRQLLEQRATRLGQESVQAWQFQGIKEGKKGGVVALSALNGEGVDRLLQLLDQRLSIGQEHHELKLRYEDGAALAWLYEHGHIAARKDGAKHIRLAVEISPANWGRFQALHALKQNRKNKNADQT